jgi:hypothetical protein|nr:MAG TPA: hypothetical protein [Caudoviricetes sp.]
MKNQAKIEKTIDNICDYIIAKTSLIPEIREYELEQLPNMINALADLIRAVDGN